MNTVLIITMGTVAVGTAVVEKICTALGKQDMSDWVRVGGTSLVGATAVGLAINLLNTVRKMF
jgi:hypothetical protein